MRDDRHLLRWLELSWFAPMPLSMGLAIWAIMTRPDPAVLAVMLVLQMALMASACSVAAGLAARRSQVWWRRVAPSGFTRAVHRTWREQTLTLLLLGLIGPTAAAVRAGDMGAWALVGWALALPLLGAMLGTLAAWAWTGSLRPTGLALWPALAGVALWMALTPDTWLDAPGHAVASLSAGLLLLAAAWQLSHHLQPRWTGMRPWLSRWRRPPTSLRRWRWDTLAFDDVRLEAARSAPWWTQHLPFVLLGLSGAAPLKALVADEIAGRTAFDFAVYICMLFTYSGTGLIVRVGHWRLRLAPGGPSPRRQVGWMLLASTLAMAALLASISGWRAWHQGLSWMDLSLPLARAVCDAALSVGLAAWLRGHANRGLPTMLALLGLIVSVSGALWLLHTHGLSIPRGPAALAAEAACAAALMLLALHAWESRVLRGVRHHEGPQPE